MSRKSLQNGMAYIRISYGVPAKRGGRVLINGYPGTITGSQDAYLRVRLDNADRSRLFHPTWRVEYIKTPDTGREIELPVPSRSYIKVWRFEDAPKEYCELSPYGGDEDWLAFVPDAFKDERIPWLMERAFGNGVSVHPVAGGEVHISAH